MAVADLETIHHKLSKRGFRRDDLFFHDCDACKAHAVCTYKIFGRTGGRDISLCLECGVAKSWRSGATKDLPREQDPGFDLRAFLGMTPPVTSSE